MSIGLKGFSQRYRVKNNQGAGGSQTYRLPRSDDSEPATDPKAISDQLSRLQELAEAEREWRRAEREAIDRALNVGSARKAELEALLDDSLSPSTRASHEHCWRDWARWAARNQVPELPAHPRTLALFMLHQVQQGRSASTIFGKLAAILRRNRAEGYLIDRREGDLALAIAAVKRRSPPARAKKALTIEQMHQIAGRLDFVDLRCKRDRALILLGFWSAMRRSEIVALTVDDLVWTAWGVEVLIRRSKTDQSGAGQKVALLEMPGVSTCPVAALKEWLTRSKIDDGPVFRSVRGTRNVTLRPTPLEPSRVTSIVREACEMIGLNPREHGSHSLRSGFATSALQEGASITSVQAVLRHRDPIMTTRYAQQTERHRTEAARALAAVAAMLDNRPR